MGNRGKVQDGDLYALAHGAKILGNFGRSG